MFLKAASHLVLALSVAAIPVVSAGAGARSEDRAPARGGLRQRVPRAAELDGGGRMVRPADRLGAAVASLADSTPAGRETAAHLEIRLRDRARHGAREACGLACGRSSRSTASRCAGERGRLLRVLTDGSLSVAARVRGARGPAGEAQPRRSLPDDQRAHAGARVPAAGPPAALPLQTIGIRLTCAARRCGSSRFRSGNVRR